SQGGGFSPASLKRSRAWACNSRGQGGFAPRPQATGSSSPAPVKRDPTPHVGAILSLSELKGGHVRLDLPPLARIVVERRARREAQPHIGRDRIGRDDGSGATIVP